MFAHTCSSPTIASKLLRSCGFSVLTLDPLTHLVVDPPSTHQAGYEARAKARSMGTNYYEAAAYHQAGRFPASLPESLKPKPGLPQQQRVYDDFARLPRLIPPHPLARQGEGGQGGQVGSGFWGGLPT